MIQAILGLFCYFMRLMKVKENICNSMFFNSLSIFGNG